MATAFPSRTSKHDKARRGRTATKRTPIAIRSQVELSPGFPERIRSELAGKLGHAAEDIERGTVRFEDTNGPRGGIDTLCRIKLVLSGRPSVQVEERAAKPQIAFARALPRLKRSLVRKRAKQSSTSAHRRSTRTAKTTASSARKRRAR